ncbi:MAG TPA: hypothetical protein VG755_38045 [Nannocystaceae bacterium]|nr:hypothetical protein [Nannocystaceae bacterium]
MIYPRFGSTMMTLLALAGCADDAGGSGDSSGTHGTSSGGQTSSSADTGTSAGSSGPADSSSSSDDGETGGMLDPTPILERDPMISHACAETREMAQLPQAMASRWDGLVQLGDAFVALRSSMSLELVGIDLAGVIGETLELDAFAENLSFADPQSVRVDDAIAVVWTRQHNLAGEVLQFAQANAELAQTIATTEIASGNIVRAASLVAVASGGFALVYGEADTNGATRLRFMRVGDDGAPMGAATDIADVGDAYGFVSARLLATADGFAVAYTAGEAIDGREVYFVALDDAGAVQGAATRVSRVAEGGWTSELGSRPRRDFVQVGDRYWLAFTEGQVDTVAQTGAIVVRIAVLDGSGHGDAHLLQAPVEGINHLWPSFVELDDRVGIAWTSGHIIWICGGCITDYDLHFVLLEPDAIVPASEEIVQLHHTNGITAPLAAVAGGDVLTLGSLDFHATTLPASGSLHCDPAG